MKEAVGSTWIFTIVITLLLFFTAFVSLSTNYTRTYKIKDEIITILTNKKGVNENAIRAINEELFDIGYSTKGTCPDGTNWFGYSKTKNNGKVYGNDANYCIKVNTVICRNRTAGGTMNDGPIGHPPSNYYTVLVFFAIDIPVMRDIFTVNIQGETPTISWPDDELADGYTCRM